MRRRKHHHHVYVVELSKDVLNEPRFRKCNPGYIDGKPWLRRAQPERLEWYLRHVAHQAKKTSSACV